MLSGDHDAIGTSSVDLDVTDFAAVKAFARDARPDVIIHAAAWTDVDGCAADPDRAVQVNGFGAQHVALAAAEVGAALVYVSTNEVFDGESRQPYREYDVTQPVNAYGYSKWVGERAVMTLNPRHYIVRTSWVFAHGGKNFVQTMLNAAQAGKNLRVVTNEIASPTYNDDLAEAIVALIQTARFGVYHFTNAGACSRWQFARYILDRAGYADTPITPILSHQWQRPSTPPLYTPLANHAGRLVGIELRPWQSAVDAFLEREGLRA
jgi:dTDP-4-dehydrorhamnose reductase